MVELRAGMKMSWVGTGRAAAQELRSYAALGGWLVLQASAFS
jgi:hypothetical protein